VEFYGGYLVAESIGENDIQFILRAVNNHDRLVATVSAFRGHHDADYALRMLDDPDDVNQPTPSNADADVMVTVKNRMKLYEYALSLGLAKEAVAMFPNPPTIYGDVVKKNG
jgi:hypothetical protein